MRAHLSKPRSWAAVVFGDTALEVTTARPAGNEFNVVLQTTEPLPAPVEGQGSLLTTTQSLRQRVDLREHQIVTAIGCEEVFCQTLRLPTIDPGELKQMLDLQIDTLTPLPVEEVVYSFQSLETVQNETRVLVAVARKAAINERVAALEAVGWQVEVVSIDALAVFRDLVRQHKLPGDAKLNTLVLIGSAAAHIIIYTGGDVVAVRSLILGADGVSEAGAQEAIREELTRTLVAVEVERAGLEAGGVTFTTWREALRPQVAALAQSWSGPAELLANGSSPNPSLSVCLDTARAGATQLNLLPDQWRVSRRKARARRLVIRGAIALAIVYVVVLAGFLSLMAAKQVQLRQVASERRSLDRQYEQARDLQQTLLTMQKQLDKRYSALEVLREVSQLLPENVKLNGFNFRKDDTVVLKAQAQSAALTTDFISRLEKSDTFAKVTAGQRRIDSGTGLTKFDVTCTLKTAAAGYGTK